MLLKGIIGAFLMALMAACSTPQSDREAQSTPPPAEQPSETPPIDEETRWDQRIALLSSWADWSVRGKVAYSVPEDSGSANLHWQQAGDDSTLWLRGPLGAGSTRISNDGPLLRVLRDGIERRYPADAAPWLPGNRLLPVPIASIQYWLRGLPDPALPFDTVQRADGLATVINQSGWEIRLSEYEDTDGVALPARLSLRAPAADLKMKLVLRRWEVPEHPTAKRDATSVSAITSPRLHRGTQPDTQVSVAPIPAN